MKLITGSGTSPGWTVEPGEIDRAAVEPRRRAGLETADAEIHLAQPRAQRLRGRIARASRFVVVEPDVNQPRQERSRRQDDRIGFEAQPDLRDHARHARRGAGIVEREIVDRLLEQREVRLAFEARPDGLTIEHAVRLRAGGAHRRSLARVEGAELDASLVGGKRHGSAQRVDLLDEVPLADSADRRITRHLTERFDAVGQQQRAPAHPCGGERRLGPGMAAADDDDVESSWEDHDFNRISAV